MTIKKILSLFVSFAIVFVVSVAFTNSASAASCPLGTLTPSEVSENMQPPSLITVSVSDSAIPGFSEVTIHNNTSGILNLDLANYEMFDQSISDQQFYNDSGTITVSCNSSQTVTVPLPSCMAQSDLYNGPAAPTTLYDGIGGFLAWDFYKDSTGAPNGQGANGYGNAAPSSNFCEMPVGGSCGPSASSVTVGSPVTWTAYPTGGNGTYTYSWLGSESLSGPGQAIQKSYTTAGTKTATVTITSNNGAVTESCGTVTVTQPVAPPLGGSCAASPNPSDVGDLVSWTATPTGGTGSYIYSWTGTGDLSGDSQTVYNYYDSPGTETGTVTITSGSQSFVANCSDTVDQPAAPPTPLTGSCSASPASANIGGTLTWTATASGGSGSYHYSWSGSNGLSGTSDPITSQPYYVAGPQNATVTISDGTQTISPTCSGTVKTYNPPIGLESYQRSCELPGSYPKVGLRWIPNWISTSTDQGYRVYRSTSENGIYTEITGPSPLPGYSDGNILYYDGPGEYTSGQPLVDYTDVTGQLTAGATYYYEINIYWNPNTSPLTAPVSAVASSMCTLTGTLAADPSSGPAPLTTTLTATTGGTVTGPITYQFMCGDGDSYSTAQTGNTFVCNYPSAGGYTSTVQISEGGLTQTATTPVTVSSSGGSSVPSAPSITGAGTPSCSATPSDRITWTSIPDATYYNVYRSLNVAGPWNINPITSPGQVTNADIDSNGDIDFTDGTGDGQILSPGTTYYYEVTAYGPSGESAKSSPDGVNSSSLCPVNNPPSGGPITLTCSASPSSAYVGDSVTWSANNVAGGDGNYTYTWVGGPGAKDALVGNTATVKKTYVTTGNKTAEVTVTDDVGDTSSPTQCVASGTGLPEVPITVNPGFGEQ